MKKRFIVSVLILAIVFSLFGEINIFAAEVNYSSKSITQIENDMVIADIDFTVATGQKYDYAIRFFDSGNASGTPFGAIRFNKEGRVLINPDARHWNQEWMGGADYFPSYEKASFTTGVKYNLKTRLDFDNGVVDYFLNDEWIAKSTGTPCGPWWTVTALGESGMQDGFEWTLNSVTSAKRGEMSAGVSEVSGKKLIIQLSETPVKNSDFSKMSVKKTNTVSSVTEIKPVSVNQNGSKLELSFDRELEYGCEYALSLPEGISGKLGGSLKDKFLYFSLPASAETIVKNYDFESTAGSFDVKKANDGYSTTAEKVNGGRNSTYGLAVKGGTTTGTNDNDSAPLNWAGFEMPKDSYTLLSFDVKPKRDDLAVAIRFLTEKDNADTPIMLGFSKSGKIVGGYRFDNDGIMKGEDSWWGQRMELASYKSNEWVNLKIEWNNDEKTGKIYVNDEEVHAKSNTYDVTSAASNFTGIDRVRMYSYQNLMPNFDADAPLMVIDNVKVTVIKNALSVKSVRFNDVDGNTVGPYDKLSRKIDSVDVTFNEEIDPTEIDGLRLMYNETDVDYDAEYDSGNKKVTLYPSVLPPAGAKISVSVNDIKDSERNTTVSPYACYITADNETDKLYASSFKLTDTNGDEITTVGGETAAEALIVNTSTDEKKAIVSVMGYNDSALQKFEYKVVSIAPRTMLKLDLSSENSVTLNTDGMDSVCATVTAESGEPLSDCFFAGNNLSDGEFVISAKDIDESVSVEVYVQDMTFANLSGTTDFRNVLIYKTQLKSTDEKASFNINYDGAKSGMYKVVVKGAKYSDTYDFLYVNPTASSNAVEKLKSAIAENSADKVSEVILNSHYDLYLNDTYVNKDIADSAALIILNYKESSKLNVSNAKTLINRAVGIAALNSNAIEDVFDENEVFDFENSDLKDIYNASYITMTMRRDITEYAAQKCCGDIDDFFDCIAEKTVLEVVKNPGRPGSIAKVLSVVGLDNYDSDAYNSVSGIRFNSLSELKETLDKHKTSSGGSSGGGSSGGGGRSYEFSSSVTNDTNNTNDTNDTNNQSDAKNSFSDLSGFDWAREEINALYEKGVVSGNGNGCFEPERAVRREEFVKLVCEAFGFGKSDAKSDFEDVAYDSWYGPYVSKAVELGLINGVSDTKFGSGLDISREDMAVIILRAVDKNIESAKSATGSKSVFSDVDDVSDYAKEAVAKLADAGIINGDENGRFAPKNSATRAETAVIIYRCKEKFSL